ncbi:MAG: helix-turn-helix transcriptional regulator [Oscillospiraceae bacterium]|nr:helix-turn-helix transcriptional regulator [Oscillospiraceae bacterium]
MSRTTVMRCLREKYGITTRELAEAAGVSQQYISDLELGRYIDRYDYRKSGVPLILRAFEIVATIKAQQVCGLLADLTGNRSRLLDYMEENDEL